jgi:hypothetical protein
MERETISRPEEGDLRPLNTGSTLRPTGWPPTALLADTFEEEVEVATGVTKALAVLTSLKRKFGTGNIHKIIIVVHATLQSDDDMYAVKLANIVIE